MSSLTLLNSIKRLRSIAHLGLTYSRDEYDTERYLEIEKISLEMMQMVTEEPVEALSVYFNSNKEYITPKVDIRAVIFNDKKEILLVKEKGDGKWSLPGGWADIGQSPKETAIREVLEETGFIVKPIKLLAVLDKRCHQHPPQLDYVYKMFIECQVTNGEYIPAFDIIEVRFFSQNNIPELSEDRVLLSQINLLFEYLENPEKQTTID